MLKGGKINIILYKNIIIERNVLNVKHKPVIQLEILY